MRISFIKNKLITFLSILFLIGLWKVGSLLISRELILPSPEQTVVAVCKLFMQDEFVTIVGTTVLRGITGFFIAFVLAIALGLAAGINNAFYAFLKPILVVIRSVPVISFILLALIWLDVDQVPVFIALLTMFPFICTNVIDGIRNVNPKLLVMAKVYRVKKQHIIQGIYLPAISPFIFSGAASAMGFGWRAIIIGEVLSQPKYGIGTFMQNAQTYLLVDRVIAWTIIAILLSYLFDQLIRFAEKKVVVWK